MPTRNVDLTPYLDGFVGAAVASGRYQNASEVVREGLRILEEQERVRQAKIARLRAALEEAEADVARGDCIVINNEAELDVFMDKIWDEHQEKFEMTERSVQG